VRGDTETVDSLGTPTSLEHEIKNDGVEISSFLSIKLRHMGRHHMRRFSYCSHTHSAFFLEVPGRMKEVKAAVNYSSLGYGRLLRLRVQ
jgi:hypothetical protein